MWLNHILCSVQTIRQAAVIGKVLPKGAKPVSTESLFPPITLRRSAPHFMRLLAWFCNGGKLSGIFGYEPFLQVRMFQEPHWLRLVPQETAKSTRRVTGITPCHLAFLRSSPDFPLASQRKMGHLF